MRECGIDGLEYGIDGLKYGIDGLKNEIMEGVPLDEISKRSIEWCAVRWYIIMGITHGGMLREEVFKDKDYYYGNLIVELEKRIRDLGGKVVPMESIEIPGRWLRALRRILYVLRRILTRA